MEVQECPTKKMSFGEMVVNLLRARKFGQKPPPLPSMLNQAKMTTVNDQSASLDKTLTVYTPRSRKNTPEQSVHAVTISLPLSLRKPHLLSEPLVDESGETIVDAVGMDSPASVVGLSPLIPDMKRLGRKTPDMGEAIPGMPYLKLRIQLVTFFFLLSLYSKAVFPLVEEIIKKSKGVLAHFTRGN
jgi:hypothetical protein